MAAGFVIFPADVDDHILSQITDSKKLTSIKRQALLKVIQSEALSAQVGWASVDEIDSMGIAPATKLAMQRAIEESLIRPDYLLIDAVKLDDLPVPQQSIIKGDQISRTIAAAAITVNGVGNLSGKFFWGYALQRFDPRKLVFLAYSLSALGVALMLSTNLGRRDGNVVAIDVGTNGEIVLQKGKELFVKDCF